MIEHIDGLAALSGRYDGYILDVWGTMYDGFVPYPGVIEALGALRRSGAQVLVLSNSPRLPQVVADRLKPLGIGADLYDVIVTSGGETHQRLKDQDDDFTRGLGAIAFEPGPGRFPDILPGTRFSGTTVASAADWVLNSGPETDDIPLEDHRGWLEVAARRQLPMICANPDRTVVHGDAVRYCAGSMAELYQSIGGEVKFYGKPYGEVFERCLGLLDDPDPSRVLMVGDNLATDIKGGRRAGLDTLLLAGGVHASALGVRPGDAPTPATVDRLLGDHGENPTLIAPLLRW